MHGPKPGSPVGNLNQMLKNPGLKMVEGDDKQRATKCLQAIQEILQRYDCRMHPLIALGAEGVVQASVRVLPVPRQPTPPEDEAA